jgi:hypothetical protein
MSVAPATGASPTTRTLRRGEHPRRPAFVGLFTDHVWSKLVALLFAGVLVFLIDRELAVDLFDGELPVRVVAAADAGAAPRAGANELVLVTEDGVAVHRIGAAKVRVLVRGRRKVADYFRAERAVVGRAVVRRAWLAGGYTSRILDGSEFDLGVPVESVRFERPLQVDFDAEVEAELRLEPSFVDVPEGFAAAATFRPPRLRVLGAAAWLSRGAAVDRATLEIDCGGRAVPFEIAEPAVPDELARRFIRPAPGALPRVAVSFAEAEDATLKVEGVPLRFLGGPRTDFEFVPQAPRDAARPTVTVFLRGPRSVAARWGSPAGLEELRRRLQAQVDADAVARTAAEYFDDPSKLPPEVSVDVEVLRIPEGLRVEQTERVDVQIKRRAP